MPLQGGDGASVRPNTIPALSRFAQFKNNSQELTNGEPVSIAAGTAIVVYWLY